MNIERLFKLIDSNPDNLSIQYTNRNGKERLIINGQDVSEEDNINDEIISFKENINSLPDYVFEPVLEVLEENIDLKKFNNLIDSEKHLSAEDSDYVKYHMEYINNIVKDTIRSMASELASLINKF